MTKISRISRRPLEYLGGCVLLLLIARGVPAQQPSAQRAQPGQVPAGLPQRPAPQLTARYVGSRACQACHADIYARWQKTLMANVVRDPREHPDAIIPDLALKTDDIYRRLRLFWTYGRGLGNYHGGLAAPLMSAVQSYAPSLLQINDKALTYCWAILQ
jgi:hypothetical protein